MNAQLHQTCTSHQIQLNWQEKILKPAIIYHPQCLLSVMSYIDKLIYYLGYLL